MTNKDSWTPSPEQAALVVARKKITEQAERIEELKEKEQLLNDFLECVDIREIAPNKSMLFIKSFQMLGFSCEEKLFKTIARVEELNNER